ncbi:uncharacterized protein LOC129738081 [Uranotaenia lowii]|uniref:uncharacterized protein LOC129738081 n=1 Tax=Uranotaenia lowii TaxID=190385 RepID=UPI002479F150|nr:uncharacterized protein LOC129738081 [Uranotaenia lowii]
MHLLSGTDHAAVVLLLIAGFGSVPSSAADFNIVEPQAFCKFQANRIYVDIVGRLIDRFHYLIAIETMDSTQDPMFASLQCALDGIKKPLILYKLKEFIRQTHRKQQDPAFGKDINAYSKVETFLSRGTYEIFTQYLIPTMAIANPLARLILVGLDLEPQQIVDIFKLTWLQYGIPNMLIINRRNITAEICLLNPFLTEPGMIGKRNIRCEVVHSLAAVKHHVLWVEQFFKQRIRNLQGYRLRVAIGDVEQMSMPLYGSDGRIVRYEYLDGEIVEIIRQYLNSTIEYVILPGQLSTGFVYPNGSVGGSLELIRTNRIDLAANSRIIHSYNIQNLQYLRQLTTTKLVFIVPKNYYQSRSKDRVFFNIFTWSFYAVNFTIAAVFPLLLKLVDRHQHSYSGALMYTLSVTLAVSTRLPKNLHARLVLCGIMIYTLISYSIWQAVIIKRLNIRDDRVDDLQTLEELLDSKLFLKIPVAYGDFLRPSLQQKPFSMDVLHQKLYQEASIAGKNVTGATLITEMLTTKASAVLIHDLRTETVRARFFDNEQMQSLIHVINEHIFEFYTAMALPKVSPLLEPLNEITVRCVETGIVAHQLNKIQFKGTLYMIAKNRANPNQGMHPGAKRFDLGVWRNVFFFYAGLNALAFLVFLMELAVHKWSTRNRCAIGHRSSRYQPARRSEEARGSIQLESVE